MEIRNTPLPGCFELRPRVFQDARGRFIKTFHHDFYAEHGLNTIWKEEYYTTSHRHVIRGLHFQVPPEHHAKMVYCLHGDVIDVLLDIRVGSPSYGQFTAIELNAELGNVIYIPHGIAHGFCVRSESAIMQYKVSTVYSAEHDRGIKWNSIGFEWPVTQPIVSDRDNGFARLDQFESPFLFKHD